MEHDDGQQFVFQFQSFALFARRHPEHLCSPCLCRSCVIRLLDFNSERWSERKWKWMNENCFRKNPLFSYVSMYTHVYKYQYPFFCDRGEVCIIDFYASSFFFLLFYLQFPSCWKLPDDDYNEDDYDLYLFPIRGSFPLKTIFSCENFSFFFRLSFVWIVGNK